MLILDEKSIFSSQVLLRWRSSLWKLVWKKLLAYILVFYAISLLPAFAFGHSATFKHIILWCRAGNTGLPLTFLLGFYVNRVVTRWWGQYVSLPFPDEVAMYLNAAFSEKDKKGKDQVVKKTVVRYLILSYVLCMRRLSSRMRRKYPTSDSALSTNLVREDEATLLGEEGSEQIVLHGGSNWWLPLKWSVDLVRTARLDGRIPLAPAYMNLVAKISSFRSSLTLVSSYGHVTIPLVYTQVVHLAVYSYFAVELLVNQAVPGNDDGYLARIPIFMILKFLFYFGWLEVAETLYNPFGEDDDDFELDALLNRHIKVVGKIVDQVTECPALKEDQFWKPPEGEEHDSDWAPTLDTNEPENEETLTEVETGEQLKENKDFELETVQT